jgi:NADH-quinone oxidoreductase subunit G
MSVFSSVAMNDYADFILPVAAFGEYAGTFVNIEGRWQSYRAVSLPHADSRPAWKIIHALANLMELSGFQYESSQDVCDDVKKIITDTPPLDRTACAATLKTLAPIKLPVYSAMPHAYRVDSLVRRSKPLQACLTESDYAVQMNQHMAESLGIASEVRVLVSMGNQRVKLPLLINPAVADDVIIFPLIDKTAGFIAAEGEITIGVIA